MPGRFQTLSCATLCSILGVAGAQTAQLQPEPTEKNPDRMLLADFDGDDPRIDPLSGAWRTVNDNIMGGRSRGGGEIQGGMMVFQGSTNTNGGGFSSIRAGDKPGNNQWDLSDFNALAARVRADGRRYVFHIQTGLRVNNSEVFYRGSFETQPLIKPDADPHADPDAPSHPSDTDDALWQQVVVPFADFVPMIRGRDMSARIGPFDPAAVRGIGLMIDDGRDGPFRLETDWIMAIDAGTDTHTAPDD